MYSMHVCLNVSKCVHTNTSTECVHSMHTYTQANIWMLLLPYTDLLDHSASKVKTCTLEYGAGSEQEALCKN